MTKMTWSQLLISLVYKLVEENMPYFIFTVLENFLFWVFKEIFLFRLKCFKNYYITY